VENFVDNPPLTAADARIGAGFNRLLKRGANFLPFLIKQLENLLSSKKKLPEKISFAFPAAITVHKMHWATNGRLHKPT